MSRFPYGAVLKVQREFSLDDIKRKLDDMKRCGMNTVVIWPAVFWWEPKTNANYPFQTGIEILEHAERIGMKVIMELAGQITSLEYMPDYLMKEEYYAVKLDGTIKNDSGVFDYINYNHPEVKSLVRANFTAVAKAYSGYSALYGYDILNETMFTSYDRHTLQVYRTWLARKYGTLDRLNEVWDRAYLGWNQIEFNFWQWPSVMPFVDWQQFRKENIGMILSEWRGYVREVDPIHPCVADNIGSMVSSDMFYSRPHDDWNAAANVDEYGISFYPKENLAGTPHYKRWETFVGVHSATKTGRFWISELQSHHRNMFNPGSIVYPYELKWWNWEAISHGAKGMIYWKWDPFIKGNQTSGRGLVDAKGSFTPRAFAAAEVGAILSEHSDAFMTYEPEKPRAAILYDKLTHDFTKAFTPAVPQETSIYVDSIAGLYESLWELNIPVKFITPDDVKNGLANDYRALFLVNQLTVGPELAEALRRYAEQGGTVIADGKFGDVREDGLLNEDQPGGALNEVLGYRLIDIDPLQLDITLGGEGDSNSDVVTDSDHGKRVLPGYFERKLLAVEDPQVEVWGRYADGYPAILCSRVGQGRIVYASTLLWYGYHKSPNQEVLAWLKRLDLELGLSLHGISDSELKFCTLRGDDGLLLFVFNYAEEAAASDIVLNGIETEPSAMEDISHRGDLSAQWEQGRLKLHAVVPGREVGIYKFTWRDSQ